MFQLDCYVVFENKTNAVKYIFTSMSDLEKKKNKYLDDWWNETYTVIKIPFEQYINNN